MKRFRFLFLSLAVAATLVGCNIDNGRENEDSKIKKLSYGKAAYAGTVEGTELERYIVTLWSDDRSVSSTDHTKNGVSVQLELITSKPAKITEIVAGEYIFSSDIAANTILSSANSTLNIVTAQSYGDDIELLSQGTITIASFKGDYEIKGEVSDVADRDVMFRFYGKIEFEGMIDFETAALAAQTSTYSNILWGREQAVEADGVSTFHGILYREDIASFGSHYSYDGQWEAWGGFAFSSNKNLENLGFDLTNQFSVYAPTASKFAVGFAFGEWEGPYGNPIIEFSELTSLVSADIANANNTYHYCVANSKIGDEGAEEDIWVNLIVTGYKGDTESAKLTVELAKGTQVLADWKNVNLSALGEVDKLVFSIESNDVGEFGLNVPAYFCIDNILLK